MLTFTPAQRAAGIASGKKEIDALIKGIVPAMFQGMARQYETDDLVAKIGNAVLDGAAKA